MPWNTISESKSNEYTKSQVLKIGASRESYKKISLLIRISRLGDVLTTPVVIKFSRTMQGQLSPHRELQLLASYGISLMLHLEELEEIDLVSQHLEHGQFRLFRNHTQLDVDKASNGIHRL